MNTRSSTRHDFVSFSLRDLATPLFRRKWVLVVTFLVVFAAVTLAGLLAPPQFTSQMAILVNRERLDPVVTTQATPDMVNLGSPEIEYAADHWTAITRDRRPSAHCEHTVLITQGAPEILTLAPVRPGPTPSA